MFYIDWSARWTFTDWTTHEGSLLLTTDFQTLSNENVPKLKVKMALIYLNGMLVSCELWSLHIWISQRCQPGTILSVRSWQKILIICKQILTNCQHHCKTQFWYRIPLNTPIYNKQTKHNLLWDRSFTFVLTKHSWCQYCHCKQTTVQI